MSEMSEKALMTARKREYRTTQRERYRRSVFIVEYTKRKHKRLYEEANSFYEKLVKRYPTKTKLTTSPEFKTWEATIEKDHDPATCPEFKTWEATIEKDHDPATCPEFKTWEETIEKDHDPATQMAHISISSSTTTPNDLSSLHNIQLNIPLMDSNEVQEMQDTVVFQDIYPSLLKEINPEILDQIISEIEESDVNIFNDDEDINDILNIEINNSMNELSPLEKELLMH